MNSENVIVKFKRLRPDATIPAQATEGAAGYDIYAAIDSEVTVAPGEVAKIGTGVAMAIPKGYVGLLFARSGLAIKSRLALANSVGVIDSDYRGELIVAICNEGRDAVRVIHSGERIAQMLFMAVPKTTTIEVTELDETERGSGGFGSTGIN